MITDAFEAPAETGRSYFVSELEAFFDPPTSGNYTFFLASDDQSQLYGTHLAGGFTVG
jgi:hypothetical protein